MKSAVPPDNLHGLADERTMRGEAEQIIGWGPRAAAGVDLEG